MVSVVVLLLALLAPALLLALALALGAVLPGTRPPLRVRRPAELREPGDLSAARADLDLRAPEWAAALRS